MGRTLDPDGDVLSVPQAARYLGCSVTAMRTRLRDDTEFREAVVIRLSGQLRISRPLLLRFLHGDAREYVSV